VNVDDDPRIKEVLAEITRIAGRTRYDFASIEDSMGEVTAVLHRWLPDTEEETTALRYEDNRQTTEELRDFIRARAHDLIAGAYGGHDSHYDLEHADNILGILDRHRLHAVIGGFVKGSTVGPYCEFCSRTQGTLTEHPCMPLMTTAAAFENHPDYNPHHWA